MSSSISLLRERLLRKAGYHPDQVKDVQPHGGQYHEEFCEILKTLAYIGGRKTDEYGDFRMQDIRSFDREVWGSYWDIQRKFGRLEQQLLNAGSPQFYQDSSGLTGAVADVMETLGDQAVYCVRMIQILRRLEEKGMLK